MPRLVLLGVSSAHPRGDSDPASLVVEEGGAVLLVDCGGSPLQRLLGAGLEPAGLRGVFLTHNHADHLTGFPLLLHGLRMLGREEELVVLGSGPTLGAAHALLRALGLEGEGYGWVSWRELPVEAREVAHVGPFRLASFPVVHNRPTLGLRVEAGGSRIVYSADTGRSLEVEREARGAEVLVHEMGVLEGDDYPYHTNPEALAEVAEAASPGLLVVVHTPPLDWTAQARIMALLRRRFAGRIDFGEPHRSYVF